MHGYRNFFRIEQGNEEWFSIWIKQLDESKSVFLKEKYNPGYE